MLRVLLLGTVVGLPLPMYAADDAGLPTGQRITPLAAPGAVFGPLDPHVPGRPGYLAGQAQTAAASPDGKTLLVLTSGYNKNRLKSGAPDAATSTEFVFVFDISAGRPRQMQALPVANSFSGVAWSPDSARFYVGGGKDDCVHVFSRAAQGFAEAGAPIALHDAAYGVPGAGLGLYALSSIRPAAAGLTAGIAVTADGKRLAVAALENDVLDVVDLPRGAVRSIPLRPGAQDAARHGVAGGEFPYWVTVTHRNVAYVSSERDREIDVVDLDRGRVTGRIPVQGNPNRMVLNKAETRLFVTADNSDLLLVIDTASGKIVAQARMAAPSGLLAQEPNNGVSPNSLALSPDERRAYVTDAAMNDVAVVDVSGAIPVVKGLIPTGFEPTSVAVSADGGTLYVVNAQGITGPNPNFRSIGDGSYGWQLSKAGFLSLPVPKAETLDRLTGIVAANNHFLDAPREADAAMMRFLRAHIRHVIYIVKENRTYDQILGDLGRGDGDPSLAMFGEKYTPNFHAIARQFVDLDHYDDPALSSMDGWQFSTAGRVADLNRKVNAVNYGKGGGSYDSEGASRGVNVGLASAAERERALPLYARQAGGDPDLLPGTANEVAPDGPDGEREAGFIWDAALRAKVSMRNYGFLVDLMPYRIPASLGAVPVLRDPYASKTVVAFPANASLQGVTDPYFRGFDTNLPDFYREREWEREFAQFEASGKLPGLETVRLMMDHTGSFATTLDRVNTPEIQQADNDYAVGRLIERVAHSRYAHDTLIFVTEDDSQDGPDHVDMHRSTAYVAGPYVKHGAVISTPYSTQNMLRTICDVLGLKLLNLELRTARPMTEVFGKDVTDWNFAARPADVLVERTDLPLPGKDVLKQHASAEAPLHDAAWWARATSGFDFSREDLNDEAALNRVLWRGVMGDAPYPAGKL
jgi:DNA-binding beta-propeller fold protein YncE